MTKNTDVSKMEKSESIWQEPQTLSTLPSNHIITESGIEYRWCPTRSHCDPSKNGWYSAEHDQMFCDEPERFAHFRDWKEFMTSQSERVRKLESALGIAKDYLELSSNPPDCCPDCYRAHIVIIDKINDILKV